MSGDSHLIPGAFHTETVAGRYPQSAVCPLYCRDGPPWARDVSSGNTYVSAGSGGVTERITPTVPTWYRRMHITACCGYGQLSHLDCTDPVTDPRGVWYVPTVLAAYGRMPA